MGNKGYLTDNEIIELVEKYIREDIYNYAVLIDGEWGSGKTYFTKNVLIKSIEEKTEKKVIYVSLYGIKSISDISNELYICLADKKVGQPLRKIITTGAKIGTDAIKFFGVELNDYMEDVKELINLKDYILIFDDLERCDCNINEVLGFINSFVEHEGIKIILIANESEIGKNNEIKNQELKYLIASQSNISDSNISDSSLSIRSNNKNDNLKNISISDIKQRVKLIFDDNIIYKQIKEKLIGITVKYNPNFEEIYLELIKKCVNDKELIEILEDNLFQNLNYAKEKKHFNLRTYQFFLSKITHINYIIKSAEVIEYKEIMKIICDYCYRICVLYKSGIYESKWLNENLYGMISLDSDKWYGNYILGFKFIDDYIVDSKLNQYEVIKVINLYLEEKKNEEKKKMYEMFNYNWWEMSEMEVRNQINITMEFLREDKDFIKVFPKALQLFITLESIGFESSIIDNAVNIVKERIKNEKDFGTFDEHSAIFQEQSKFKRYKQIIEPIKKEMDISKSAKDREEVNKYLEYDDWGLKLYKYIDTLDKEKKSLKEKSFINHLDIYKLSDKIKSSNSFNISYFRYAINEIYSFSNIKDFYGKDANNIEKMIKLIKKVLEENEFDIIKKENLKMLIYILEEKYELLK
ncbi:P-loop NTPase fold protein [Clostridium tertium]|uniref:P-loop NTPase fold protein n=1 Tax=Clostridium tertium TaxID=1559 RepID=UPI00232CC241|nr:P-loop NTPase fold protein [Clostridium tertium]MDB1943706.1 P-loop NTPase fold protein [Clostridium tertium]MDB1951128.1 P-loop NTPase fold protein [Clostridium tertium]